MFSACVEGEVKKIPYWILLTVIGIINLGPGVRYGVLGMGDVTLGVYTPPLWAFWVLGILSILNVVCVLALFQPRKWPFFLLMALAVPHALMVYICTYKDLVPAVTYLGFAFLGVLYAGYWLRSGKWSVSKT